MLKNNGFALLAHGFLGVIVWFLFIAAQEAFHTNEPLLSVINGMISLSALFVYYLIGGRLTDLGSKTKNLLSVSSVTVGGLLIWIYCLTVSLSQMDAGLVWILYGVYNAALFPLMTTIHVGFWGYSWISSLFALLPSLFLWLGLLWKGKKQVHRDAKSM